MAGSRKRLDRIIPRFAMDLDQTGEIRSAPIVDPVVVCEPRIVARQRDELARASVIDAERALLAPVKYAVNAWQRRNDATDFLDQCRFRNIEMGDLMIGQGKRPRLRDIEHLATILGAHGKEPGLTQGSVDVDWHADSRDPVLGQHNHPRPVPLGIGDQRASDSIDLRETFCGPRIVGPKALQVIIEMRQIDERQGRRSGAPDMQGCIGDQAR